MRRKTIGKTANRLFAVIMAICMCAPLTALAEEAFDMQDRIQNLLIHEEDYNSEGDEDSFTASNYVFIGDSRTVGMQQSVSYDPSDTWSAEVSMGYDWMVGTGVPGAEYAIGDGTAVYILLGINDLGNVYRYVSYVDAKAAEWADRGAKTFFCAVGPVGNTTVTNGQIESFNAAVISSLENAEYIDLYSALMNDGYSTADGLHYTEETYQYIYNLLKQAVGFKDNN